MGEKIEYADKITGTNFCRKKIVINTLITNCAYMGLLSDPIKMLDCVIFP